MIEEMRELYEETTSVTLERATQEFGFIEREKENQRYSSLWHYRLTEKGLEIAKRCHDFREQFVIMDKSKDE